MVLICFMTLLNCIYHKHRDTSTDATEMGSHISLFIVYMVKCNTENKFTTYCLSLDVTDWNHPGSARYDKFIVTEYSNDAMESYRWISNFSCKATGMSSRLALVRFKSDPLAAFSFRAQRGSDYKIAWNRGVGAQQKCCSQISLNCLMPVTNLRTCYASTESWGLSVLNGVRIISVGAPERISWTI